MARRKKRKSESDKYFDDLIARYGDAIFCPVCSCRPCCPGCSLGIQHEAELAEMSSLLRHLDKPEEETRQ